MSPAWEVFRPFTVFPGDFLIRKCVGKFKMSPKNVPTVFLGEIVQSVLYDVPGEVTVVYPASKIQNVHGNDATEMFQSGIFRMSWKMRPQCIFFGKIWEHFGNTVNKYQENWKTRNIQNVPDIF
jgi:hypothetical protein